MKILWIIIFFTSLLIAVMMYLVILGGSKNKSNEEIQREDEEQINYLNNYNSIYNSANKERTLNDFIEEIKTMFNVHQDETILLKIAEEIIANKEKLLITVDMKEK